MEMLFKELEHSESPVWQWRIQNFPEEGVPTPRGGGAVANIHFAKFSRKLHEIERIWAPPPP